MASGMVRNTWWHIKELTGLTSVSEITKADVRLELSELGLLGYQFSIPDECADAVQKHLGLDSLTVEDYPDRHQGVVSDNRLDEGVLADVGYNEARNEAIILVRESLRERPWPTYELCVCHELAHLIAEHHLTYADLKLYESAVKEAWANTQDGRDEIEVETRQRAKLLLLAHIAPEAFERAGMDRVA